ncbi:hypothetical protein JQC92_15600 [Shewanella sp. 202IG2-18]|uniref:hypothetical protein n=1 Tax=Parashewanella hymeniacidonis TaxID=2807618 RepID=UPI00196157FC|nr:hypothetical protein [Parashewanella hymeniacidonis]MBM7073438.1 hypothetical protein [Parashewanella hymeniacidonis]
MGNEIDYSQYSLEELFDVKRQIDRESYPERYQALVDEIEKRELRPEYIKEKCKHDFLVHRDKYDDDDDELDLSELIEIQRNVGKHLSKHKWLVVLFTALFVIVNVSIMNTLISNNTTVALSKMHTYQTEIDSAQCKKELVYIGDIDTQRAYVDLLISSYPDELIALDITASKCKEVLKKILPNRSVEIGHVDGLIHQLEHEGDTLLSYDFLKPRIINYKTRENSHYIFWLIGVWVLIAPCLFFCYFREDN